MSYILVGSAILAYGDGSGSYVNISNCIFNQNSGEAIYLLSNFNMDSSTFTASGSCKNTHRCQSF